MHDKRHLAHGCVPPPVLRAEHVGWTGSHPGCAALLEWWQCLERGIL